MNKLLLLIQFLDNGLIGSSRPRNPVNIPTPPSVDIPGDLITMILYIERLKEFNAYISNTNISLQLEQGKNITLER